MKSRERLTHLVDVTQDQSLAALHDASLESALLKRIVREAGCRAMRERLHVEQLAELIAIVGVQHRDQSMSELDLARALAVLACLTTSDMSDPGAKDPHFSGVAVLSVLSSARP